MNVLLCNDSMSSSVISQILFDAQCEVSEITNVVLSAWKIFRKEERTIGKRFTLLLLRLRGQWTNGKDGTGDYDGLILLWHYRDLPKMSAVWNQRCKEGTPVPWNIQ